jgi:L-alanine-DL-glutamate epimerase-like enolase superfamily enzyme
MEEVFLPERGVPAAWRPFEYPLWDLAGRRAGLPVYSLAAMIVGAAPASSPLRVRCYDTSLYFDDLDLTADAEAADRIAGEAREGWERGHRAFKIKVGRGARHLPLEEGTRRDIAVIRAVRAAVGPDAPLLIDANNGWNLNLTKRVLAETADCGIYWVEEPFHEDPVLYRDLKAWFAAEGLTTRIADGEGQASPTLLDWAREGLVDVIQYDIFGHGFTRWLETGRQLDAWGVSTAPHHYGGHVGNYLSCHLAGVVERFAFVEWDEASTLGLDAPGYAVRDGLVTVPDTPGFGLTLDETAFWRAVEQTGWRDGV